EGLVTAFESVRSDESSVRALDWLDARINSGGGSLLGFLYSRALWDIGSAQNVNDPDKDLRFRAGLMVLYTLQLIIIDGTKCADQSAPGHRLDQLMAGYGPVLQYLKTKNAKFKAKVIDAIALEKRTAALRKDDDWLCQGGLEEMMAGIEAGRTKQVPTPPDQIGTTVVVEPPPDYVPKFVAPEKYKPLQEKARSEIRSGLLKMLQYTPCYPTSGRSICCPRCSRKRNSYEQLSLALMPGSGETGFPTSHFRKTQSKCHRRPAQVLATFGSFSLEPRYF